MPSEAEIPDVAGVADAPEDSGDEGSVAAASDSSVDEEPEQPIGLATSDVAPAIAVAVAKLVKGKLKGRRVKVPLSAMPTQWHPHCSEFDGTGWAARV